MLFTIIIATCGRTDRLLASLRAVERAVLATCAPHRLIVVDNAPLPLARDSVDEFGKKSPVSVRYMESRPLSKSAALNTGIRAADTEWVAFTDDDTVADAGWLSQAARFIEQEPCRVFGGRVTASTDDPRLPTWVKRIEPGSAAHLGTAVVHYDPLRRTGFLGPQDPVPLGANFFVRRDVFDQHGFYDERLWDYCGRAALGVEDAEFGMRLRRCGERIGFCREGLVVHPVYPDRLRWRFLMRKAFEHGWREHVLFPQHRRAVDLFTFRLLARLFGRLALCAGRLDKAAMILCTLELAAASGVATGQHHANRQTQPLRGGMN